jgi:hypothetical protein
MHPQFAFRALISAAMFYGAMATAAYADPVPAPCDPASTCGPVPNPLPGCPTCNPNPAPDPGTAPGGPIQQPDDPH